MSIKPKNIIFILLLLPVVILFESLVMRKSNTGDCGVLPGSVLKSAGPPSCYSGEPPSNANCTAASCHDDGTPNTGTASVSLDLGAANNWYVSGQTYTISISITKSGMMSSGFQIIALTDNDTKLSPGTIALLDAARTQLIDIDNPHPGPCGDQSTKVWVEHTSTGISSVSPGTNRWSYLWTAPSSNVGSITFYLATLESNNSLDEMGDKVYTKTKTISDVTGIYDTTNPDNAIKIYPNPSQGEFLVITAGSLSKEFSVYDIHGRMFEKFTASAEKIKLDLRQHPKGVYFLKSSSEKISSVSKLVIQ